MRTFHLERNQDPTGISGTGLVAEGVQFSDGTVALRWVGGLDRSSVFWNSIDSLERVHGHDGQTKIIYHAEDGGS